MQNPVAIIVGAGPSGLATAACLSRHSIPYVILEREDDFCSLWKKHSYNRLHLHLAKQFCELPFLSFPKSYPTFIPKDKFINYLDEYVSHFGINALYQRSVEAAHYDEAANKWTVKAKNGNSGEFEEFSAKFLVVASGENSNPFTPEIDGLSSFKGDVLHSTKFKDGRIYKDKNVLVVGSGNSGMEIALDLANQGARTSIVVRSEVHVVSRQMVSFALTILKYNLPLGFVDSLLVMLSKLVYGDMSRYGITRPKEGVFFKLGFGKYPIFDIGTCKKIRSGEIQVLPSLTIINGNEVIFKNGKSFSFDTIVFCTGFKRSTNIWLQVLPSLTSINGNEVIFKNGKSFSFDTIVFCTGFKRSTNIWLQGDEYLLNEDGIAKQAYPNHWKGKNGLYCVGLSRRGLYGLNADAINVADDINSLVNTTT